MLFFLINCVKSDSIFNLRYTSDSKALCLDGTKAAYYVSKGSTNKFVINFQGGGWCWGQNPNQTIADCVGRSKTGLGSSKDYPQSIDMSGRGWLSGKILQNSDFYDATRVHIKYCTGTGHQGRVSDPVFYNGTTLYFRGHDVTLSILKDLDSEFGLLSNSKASVFVGGESAGGLATYIWADYLRVLVKGSLQAVPDSGYFIDAPSSKDGKYIFRGVVKSLSQLVNVQTAPPNSECVAAYPTQVWKCLMVDYLQPFIKAEVMVVQSVYDPWVTLFIHGFNCGTKGLSDCSPEQLSVLENSRLRTLQVMGAIGSAPRNSAWVVACTQHTYLDTTAFDSAVWKVHGATLAKVLGLFKERKYTGGYYDTSPWPSNGPCSKLNIIQ